MARILRSDAERLLAHVPGERVFWCHDGGVLKDMQELGNALSAMSDDTFGYHANDCRNDFSIWVRDVIGDGKLARDMERSKTRQQAAKHAAERLAFLSAKLT